MTVIPLPRHGQWVGDLRGQGRSVRVSAHVDVGVMNLSLWRDDTCVGTARLAPSDVATLISGLSDGLAEIAVQPPAPAEGDGGRLSRLEERLAGLEFRLAPSARPTAVARVRRMARTASTSAGRWLRDYR
ncbi:hypothetical protein DQ244_06325 [Blastococcus sp. TBT05-19]|uniref:hypothetical protein n=1 Tax=Blastococcus sp. TBT05-19 TaxID=2250581 RepID=UPI000DE8B249|nr:hypothetical protein [Blastococcus sp. TBT05-19]RBY94865.1 hypothetical protein DQ244_06325 [Blastococcus sp. TBT05-19]